MFKVGDKVRVIGNIDDLRMEHCYKVGDICEIVDIEIFDDFQGKTFYKCKIINRVHDYARFQYLLADCIEPLDNKDKYFFIEYEVGGNIV